MCGSAQVTLQSFRPIRADIRKPMTTELGLHHFYVDKRAGDHSSLSVIARSAALSEDDALALWRAADPGLSPQSRLDGLTDGFTGVTSEDGRRVLAHFRPRDEDPAVLRAHIVLLPDEIDPFLLIPMLAYEPFPDFEAPTDDLPDLFARHQTLSDAYDAFLTSMLRSTITDEDVLAGLIDCFIDGRHIAIRDAPPDPAVLVLQVEGAFALEAQHLAPLLVARINARLGWRCVGRILLRQGPVRRRPIGRVKPPPPSAAAVAAAACAVADVLDDGLRDALVRLGARALTVRAAREAGLGSEIFAPPIASRRCGARHIGVSALARRGPNPRVGERTLGRWPAARHLARQRQCAGQHR